MPLKVLQLEESDVSDLSFLEGMSLKRVHMSGTKVSDYSPLNKIPTLEWATFNERAKDLSQIKGLVDKMRHSGGLPLQDLCYYVGEYGLSERHPENCCPARILRRRHPEYSEQKIEEIKKDCDLR